MTKTGQINKTTRATQAELFAKRRAMMRQAHEERTNVNGATVTGQGAAVNVHTCPGCGAHLHATAIVTGFNEPEGWQFWGEVGGRWKRCEGVQRGYRYVHFIVLVGRVKTHRLAWIKQTEVTDEQDN